MASKANKLKSEEGEEKEKPRKVKGAKGRIRAFRNFLADERTHKISGLVLLLLSFFMLVAFTSNLFTWKTDQAVAGADSPWQLLLKNDLQVENWLGKLGAIVSLQFINHWFGICAYIFPFLFFLTGMKILFEVTLLPFGKTIRYSFFGLIWVSTFLGYIFHSSSLVVLAGGYGYQLSQSLTNLLGFIGSGALLVFTFVGFLVVAFNIPFVRQRAEVVEEPLVPAEETVPEEVVPVMNTFKTDEPPRTVELELGNEPEEEEEPEEEIAEEPVDEEEVEAEEGVPMEVEPVMEDEVGGEITSDDLVQALGEYDPKLDLSGYQYPTLDLLENYGDKKIEVNKEELEANKNRIVETLSHYNIAIDKIKATIGPTVTLFEIVPQAGVRISKIKNLEDDIALSLSALGIRIIAPIPGKGTIGIEVPNQKPEIVPMKTVLGSERFVNSDYELPIGLGKTIANEVFVADLTKMPHLLMAGATGQGKSVGLNAILVSLLYKKHPAQVKFILVDPKKVELTLFKTIERHFLAKLPGEGEAIITDTKKVVHTLNSLCMEMDQRYELMKDAQVRNIKEYNAKFIARKLNPNNGHKFLPYIILVVDEFADLIMTAGKEIETPIARLAQLARAIGIHLIIATQRPSVNIITGTIKANFPARLAFRVTSKIDSRTILDTGGADQLIGRGDMLLSTGADVIRLQCAFVDTPEVEKITEFIGSQRGYPDAHLLPEYIDEAGEGSREIDMDDRDALFEEAASIIVQHQQGSASLLQRRLKLGYNRAGRIIDQLEAAKIIGPFEGSKAREVLIKDPMTLEQILNGLRNRES
ncbi:MAG: DNA translocase FtsK 4TM domain-containing protein [Bacteroidetes bacterium]|nr:DNA translocase FtsK 4TM domain-containing protein [Bacteroidota bacterium]